MFGCHLHKSDEILWNILKVCSSGENVAKTRSAQVKALRCSRCCRSEVIYSLQSEPDQRRQKSCSLHAVTGNFHVFTGCFICGSK